MDGGAKGIRTPDLLIANETRYQLRHSPKLPQQPDQPSIRVGQGRNQEGADKPDPGGNQGSGKTRRVTVEAGSVSGGLSYSSSIDSPSSTPSISNHGISSA